MHLLIWFVPSFIENAVSAAVVGLVYGPIYPANIGIARDLLPAEVHLVSLAIVYVHQPFRITSNVTDVQWQSFAALHLEASVLVRARPKPFYAHAHADPVS